VTRDAACVAVVEAWHAGEMEVSKAVHYLKCKELEKARETLRELEKREEKDQDPATRSRAATNLAFISLLLDDVKSATEYAPALVSRTAFL